MDSAKQMEHLSSLKIDESIVDKFSVLGLPVACVQIPNVIQIIETWIKKGSKGHYCSLLGMHGIMESRRSNSVRESYLGADLLLPDGMPLVWLARLNGFQNMLRRVYGPELMTEFCHQTKGKYRQLLLGGIEGVAQNLGVVLEQKYDVNIVGTITPPFHHLSESELIKIADEINLCKPDIVWIGISTPKQDVLMRRLRPLINASVMLGVGAAFDFNSGTKKMAPKWIQESGLEWAYRLSQEPRRLWHRYLVFGPMFAWLALTELLINKFQLRSLKKKNR